MKNIYKLSLLISAFILSGCIKETFPKGSTVTKGQLEQSDQALSYMLNGISAAMMAPNAAGYAASHHWDFGIPAIHLTTEYMLEDIAVLGELGYCWFNGYYLNTYQGPEYVHAVHFWIVYYEWIKLANDVIACVGKVDEDTSEDRLDILGQALAYRAMLYLDLARLYEPKPCKVAGPDNSIIGLTVPIVTENTTERQAHNNPRATREEMYAFILEDLDRAEGYLTDGINSYTTPTLAAVYGLKARAYIELGASYADPAQCVNITAQEQLMTSEEAYEKAAEYARKVIDLNLHSPLTQAQWEDPKTGFNDGSANSAWIWGLTSSTEALSNLISNVAHRSNEAIYGYAPLVAFGVNQALYNQISDEDFRKHSWYDPDLGYQYRLAGSEDEQMAFIYGSVYNPPAQKYLSLKFRPGEGEMLDYTIGNNTDWCLMRIEEMYFLEMEAVAALPGGMEKARELLNDFMNDYRYEGYNCTYLTASHEAFIKEMMLQKRIEFWGEGVLIFDYKRLNQGILRGYTGTNIPETARFNSEGRSPQWNIVISRSEYQSNTGIKHPEENNPDPSEKLELWK